MESIQANKIIHHASEVDIKDQALVRAYLCESPRSFEVKAGSLEILLFCVREGNISLQASFIPHPIELANGEAIFLAFPREEWQVTVRGEAGAAFYITRMDVGTMHKLINPAFETKNLQQEPRLNMRDLMRLIPVNPTLMLSFDQMFHHKLNPPFRSIYEQAKFLEIFSLLMESAFGQPAEQCPVAMSPSIEYKLNRVRRHIIENIDVTPDPDRLALLYELPRNTLKEGYRFKYGRTIHQFHADHRLESAMQMLSSGEMLVKEIAFKIGYQNPSHFITAFKKKYGYTPKHYLMRNRESVRE